MIYLLAGKNSYLSWKELNKLKKEILKEDSLINIETINGDEVGDISEITKFFEMGNLFSSKSVVIVKRFFQNKSKNLKNDLARYLDETTDIIFWEEKDVDKRTVLYKFINKKGVYKEFKELDFVRLRRWIEDNLKNEGIEIETSALDKLLFRVSTDQFIIESELRKLTAYLKATNRNTLTQDDIKEMIPITKEESIWDFIDSLADKDKNRALILLESILKGPSDYPLVLALIVRQLRILYLINHYKNTPLGDLAKMMGIHIFVLRKASTMASALGKQKVLLAYEKLLSLDIKVKSGEMDPKLGLDLFVLSFL